MSVVMRHLWLRSKRGVFTRLKYDYDCNCQRNGSHQYAEHWGAQKQYTSERDVGSHQKSWIDQYAQLRHRTFTYVCQR